MLEPIPVIIGYDKKQNKLMDELRYMEPDSIEALSHIKYHDLLVQMEKNSDMFKLSLMAYLVRSGGSILKVYPWIVSLYQDVVLKYYLLPKIGDGEIKNIILEQIQKEEQRETQKLKQKEM